MVGSDWPGHPGAALWSAKGRQWGLWALGSSRSRLTLWCCVTPPAGVSVAGAAQAWTAHTEGSRERGVRASEGRAWQCCWGPGRQQWTAGCRARDACPPPPRGGRRAGAVLGRLGLVLGPGSHSARWPPTTHMGGAWPACRELSPPSRGQASHIPRKGGDPPGRILRVPLPDPQPPGPRCCLGLPRRSEALGRDSSLWPERGKQVPQQSPGPCGPS